MVERLVVNQIVAGSIPALPSKGKIMLGTLNRLENTRCYLAGAMDRVPDGGVVWREKITKVLEPLGVTVLDPCKKPIDVGGEYIDDREHHNKLKRLGHWSEIQKHMKVIRATDLRMVDISDFIILNVDVDIHMCGSYEELTLANRQKKPVIVHIEQGKHNAPNWMFGMIPYEFIFGGWPGVISYLYHVNSDEKIDHRKRWMFFDLDD